MVLYENEKYKVELNDGGTEYEVVNKETIVVEYKNTSLPRAIIVAQESSEALSRLLPKTFAIETMKPDLSNIFPLRERD